MEMSNAAPRTLMNRLVYGLANGLALFGGVCLVVACALTGLSIIGGLTFKPLPGEIELVEAFCGFAVFAFMPFCQLRRGHVGVDIFVSGLGRRAMNWTQLAGDIIIALLFIVLTRQHWIGTMDKFRNGETTTLLLLPVWWGYAVGLVLLVATVLACFYSIARDVDDIRNDRAFDAPAGGH